MVKSSASSSRVSRRRMVSVLAALPALLTITPACASAQTAAAEGPLASWNGAAFKDAIMAFIDRVTKQGSPEFVPEAERFAAFDNDGTLWAELPTHFQLLFELYRVTALVPQHSGLPAKEPFVSVREDDVPDAISGDAPAILPAVMATDTGLTSGAGRSDRTQLDRRRQTPNHRAGVSGDGSPADAGTGLLRENGSKMRSGDRVALHLPVMFSLAI
jgi:hypothetical protein